MADNRPTDYYSEWMRVGLTNALAKFKEEHPVGGEDIAERLLEKPNMLARRITATTFEQQSNTDSLFLFTGYKGFVLINGTWKEWISVKLKELNGVLVVMWPTATKDDYCIAKSKEITGNLSYIHFLM